MTASPHVTLKPPVHEGDHIAGDATAAVTLVEYGDYQCPHCRRAHPVVQALQQHFGGRLRFVFRNFPLTEIHPEALHAAEAAESVNAHSGADAFWAMHHSIFAHQKDSETALDDRHLVQYAAAVGANAVQVASDLDAGVFEDRVKEDFLSGVRSGVNGTPTFFINGVRFEGNWTDLEEFGGALESEAMQRS